MFGSGQIRFGSISVNGFGFGQTRSKEVNWSKPVNKSQRVNTRSTTVNARSTRRTDKI
ncbi:hypothetical protein Hanom_Chr13g01215731 [Helianthus anomalus]